MRRQILLCKVGSEQVVIVDGCIELTMINIRQRVLRLKHKYISGPNLPVLGAHR
jgi:hypothetical protein